MVQDALLATQRWLLGGVGLALRLLPLASLVILALLALTILARRFDPAGLDRFRSGLVTARPRATGPVWAVLAALLLGGSLVQARKLVTARRQTVDRATASRRNEPSISGVSQYAPAVAVLEEKTYRRTLTLPPDFLARIGAEGVQVLSPYLSDPSADEVLRLRDEFKRSGSDVLFTREVVRKDETPVTADSAVLALGFVGRGARRHCEATFDGTFRFRNPRSQEATMRFTFPLPQGGGTLQEFSIEAAGTKVEDPDDKGLYAWTGAVPADGAVTAKVRYRVTGAGVYDYALGSERRRIGDFRLTATSDVAPKYGRSGIYPSRVGPQASEWSLQNVITAQNVSIVFPSVDAAAESFDKTLWWLPAVLAIFALGAAWLSPGDALRATAGFGLGMLGVPTLSAYVPPVVATLVGAVLAGVLGWTLLRRGRGVALLCAVLACVFLTREHGMLLGWIVALGAMIALSARRRSRPA